MAYTRHEPVGGRLRPDNSVEFPLLMQAWKLGPALAGNTVDEAGRADAPLAFQPASSRRPSPPGGQRRPRLWSHGGKVAIAGHPNVDKVAFSPGSTEVGKIISRGLRHHQTRASWSLAARTLPFAAGGRRHQEGGGDGVTMASLYYMGQTCCAASMSHGRGEHL